MHLDLSIEISLNCFRFLNRRSAQNEIVMVSNQTIVAPQISHAQDIRANLQTQPPTGKNFGKKFDRNLFKYNSFRIRCL